MNEHLRIRLRDASAILCPSFSPNYASVYYLGLTRYINPDRIVYDGSTFSSARLQNFNGFSVLLDVGGSRARIHFDPRDVPEADPEMLPWSDVYGKVNLVRDRLPTEHSAKVVPLGPGFGLRMWGPRGLAEHGFKAFQARGVFTPGWALRYVRAYRAQLERGFEDWYDPGTSDPNYLFFVATAWSKHVDVHPPRAEFIRVARNVPGLNFEGGFAPRRTQLLSQLSDVVARKRYPFRQYLLNMKRSCVAFNTPAVHQCFGWKLGEFLALGKAIISLPLTREPPEPLVHGEHLHVVSGSAEETREALELIRRDHAYRRKLELGARAYYDRCLSPEATVGRVLAAALQD